MRKWIRISSAGLFFLFIFGCAAMEGRISNQALKLATTKADTLAARDSNSIINLPGDITPSYVQKYVVKRLAAGDTVGAQRAFRILCREGFEGYTRKTRWSISSLAWTLRLRDQTGQQSFAQLATLFDTLNTNSWYVACSDTTAVLLHYSNANEFTLYGFRGVATDTIRSTSVRSSLGEWPPNNPLSVEPLHRIGKTPFVCVVDDQWLKVFTLSESVIMRAPND